MITKKTALAGLIILCAAQPAVRPASAKDFEARIALDARSRSAGLGREEVLLLARLPGPGRNAVMETLAKRFEGGKAGISTPGSAKRVERDDSTSLLGDGWRLKVWGSGSKFSYSNQKLTRQLQQTAVPLDQRFTNAQLEAMARRFLAEALGTLVEVGPGEEIVPLSSRFAVGGGTDASGKEVERTVGAAAIRLGRRIDGVDIVGSGSQIDISFGNDGVPLGFDVDWPRYERTASAQSTVPAEEILARLKTLTPQPASAGIVSIKHLACGYYDGGELRHDPDSRIQAGCVVYQVHRTPGKQPGDEMVSAIVHAVPAGLEMVPDRNWAELAQLGLAGEPDLATSAAKSGP